MANFLSFLPEGFSIFNLLNYIKPSEICIGHFLKKNKDLTKSFCAFCAKVGSFFVENYFLQL